MRDKALWERPTNYGAVGGTRADDLLRYPPAGFRPVIRRTRIGHGAHRFEAAWTSALSWGIQRSAGMTIEAVDTPRDVAGDAYTPVSFDDTGTPIAPTRNDEASFGPDGRALLHAGDTVVLRSRLARVSLPCRVIYVVDEPLAKGFAYGTLEGSPLSGEEMFLVERAADDAVWLTVRSFSRPAHWYLWLGYPLLRIAQSLARRRYLRALTGPVG